MPESTRLSTTPSPVPSIDSELCHAQQRAPSPTAGLPKNTLDVSTTTTTPPCSSSHVPITTTTISEASQYISTAVSSSSTTTTTVSSSENADKVSMSSDIKSVAKPNAWSHDSGGSFAAVTASTGSTHGDEQRPCPPVRPSSSLGSTHRPDPQETEFVEDIESTTDFPPLARSHSDPQMTSEEPAKENAGETQSLALQMSKFPMATKLCPTYSPTMPSIETTSPVKTEQSSSGPPSEKLPFSSPSSDETDDVTEDGSHIAFRAAASKSEGQVVGLIEQGGKLRQVRKV